MKNRKASPDNKLSAALRFIAQIPGYESVADDLRRRWERGSIRFVAALPDRAQVTLTGVILVGPEALEGSIVGLAQTLIHEHHHLQQFPLEKTVSFWHGAATGKPVMRRYERPAYRAALRFLQAVSAAFPDLAHEASQEAFAVRATFAACYGGGFPD